MSDYTVGQGAKIKLKFDKPLINVRTTPIDGLSNVTFKAKAATSNSAKIKVNISYLVYNENR